MAITEIRHEWTTDPNLDPALFKPGEPAVLHITFDRELTKREAFELAQAVVGVHNRHEVARDFAANDPHRAVHLDDAAKAAMVTETPDMQPVLTFTTDEATGVTTAEPVLDKKGQPVMEPATVLLTHDDGTPVFDPEHPGVLPEIVGVTRAFSGKCPDCRRELVAGADPDQPPHYVCPSLPSEADHFIRFREKVDCEGDVIACGRPPG